MFTFIFYAIIAWIVFKWMDMLFGGRSRRFNQQNRSQTPPPPPKKKKPNSDNIGDYVDFEEVDE
ncbi:MAG: hypothetical protein CMB32_03745 [Euryarchaeota archaeon]|nr:hypothetical protein [Euryarchaeota archaeon]